MKIDKKVEAVALFEGGVDAAPQEAATEATSRQDHYKKKYGDYKATDSGVNEETGMVFERGCTDFLCGIVFLVFVASLFAVAIYGMIRGDPKRLIKPYDFNSKICDVDDEVKGFGKLYFAELETIYSMDQALCVKKCPKKKTDKLDCASYEG